MPPTEQLGPATGVLARGYAFMVVCLRYLIVGAWAAGVVLAILFLPPLNATRAEDDLGHDIGAQAEFVGYLLWPQSLLVVKPQSNSAALFTPTATMVRPLRFFSWHAGAMQ